MNPSFDSVLFFIFDFQVYNILFVKSFKIYLWYYIKYG